jgi:hypothetical protein
LTVSIEQEDDATARCPVANVGDRHVEGIGRVGQGN